MEHFNQIIALIGGIIATVLLPLMTAFQFYDSKKRKEAAAAKKAEAENITQYAAEWKELYEKKEAKVHELDTKIDQLYVEKNEDRERIRDLQSKNVKLELENQALNFKKCEVRGCKERKPPSDY
jgi:chromosome segregation ATPase